MMNLGGALTMDFKKRTYTFQKRGSALMTEVRLEIPPKALMTGGALTTGGP